MSKAKLSKIDLNLLKTLVLELETVLSQADSLKDAQDKVQHIVEMSKAAGICAGIMQESGLLVGDIQTLVAAGGAVPVKTDLLTSILGPLKGNGTN